MTNNLVLFQCENSVATLTLNRPEHLNSIDDEMRLALSGALEDVRHDPEIRVAVLTGAGRSFSAGGDIRKMIELRTEHHSADLRSFLEAGNELVKQIQRLPKPVLASVNGPAAGAGMNLALACDLRIASDQASFAQSFAKVGLHPDWGGTFFLPRLIGRGRAMEMFMLGESVSAKEAHRFGLVNFLAPHDQLGVETCRLAKRLAEGAPIPTAMLKQELYEQQNKELHLALAREVESQMKCFESEDCLEGLRAFLGKRQPNFKGS